MKNDPKTLALTYIEACGRKDESAVAALLATDVAFVGPVNRTHGAAEYLAVLRRLAPVWVRSEVKKVVADGADVCVLYDFVTDTPAGAVPITEWLHIEDGRITSILIMLDRVAFQPAAESIARRTAA